jgi:DNA-binding PadR family transcriptional regulator
VAKRRKVANPLALAVLAWLLTGPMHPYELGRRLQETGQDKQIKYNRSSLYMVVEQLAKAGFVVEQETVRDTPRPERTVYSLTPDGRAELYDWMRELLAEPQHEYPQFGVALSLLSVIPPAEAVELLGRRQATLNQEATGLQDTMQSAAQGGLPWVFLVEDKYRLALLDAENRFVSELIDSLRAPEYLTEWQRHFTGGTS